MEVLDKFVKNMVGAPSNSGSAFGNNWSILSQVKTGEMMKNNVFPETRCSNTTDKSDSLFLPFLSQRSIWLHKSGGNGGLEASSLTR